jgi:hypothetical protein
MGTRVVVALACLAVAGVARAEGVTLGLEATIGGQHLGVRSAPGVTQVSPMGDLGATALLTFGVFGVGAGAQGTFRRGSLERFDASALAGLALPLGTPLLRLELLGEVGAANLRSARDAAAAARGAGGWDRFYGVRPGLSARVPFLPFRLGVWGVARWGLAGQGSGPAYGLLGRVGVDF